MAFTGSGVGITETVPADMVRQCRWYGQYRWYGQCRRYGQYMR
jgi:hypothetical protein